MRGLVHRTYGNPSMCIGSFTLQSLPAARQLAVALRLRQPSLSKFNFPLQRVRAWGSLCAIHKLCRCLALSLFPVDRRILLGLVPAKALQAGPAQQSGHGQGPQVLPAGGFKQNSTHVGRARPASLAGRICSTSRPLACTERRDRSARRGGAERRGEELP